jgi:hypothetical protein
MQRMPLEAMTMYSELVEQLAAIEASRTLGSTPGVFVTKRVKGNDYYYFQYVDASGARHQEYLGRRDDVLDEMVRRYAENKRALAGDRESVVRLAASLRTLGAGQTDAPSARVIRTLADAGFFKAGAVLVGTHAFVAIGNLLGVSWSGAGMTTQDVDLAAPRVLEVAAPGLSSDLPALVDSLEMGFLPVPGLDRNNPSTSFKVRGKPLRIDLLTPAPARPRGPVTIARFAAAAEPLRYLDYLIETPVRAAIVAGDPALVFVPDPARFALHKLITASVRPTSETGKQHKDRAQASQLLDVLLEDRPGDVTLAAQALTARGRGWITRVHGQLRHLPSEIAEAVSRQLDEAGPRQ